jgi:hypothetical protein
MNPLLRCPRSADSKGMRALAVAVVYLGLPGLLLGLAIGIVIRRFAVLLLLGLVGYVSVRYGLREIDRGSSGDNDSRIIVEVGLVANLIGFLVGAFGGRLVALRQAR